MHKTKHIKELFQRYLDNKCNREETAQLFQLFGKVGNEEQLREFIREQLLLSEYTSHSATESKEQLLNDVLDQIKNTINAEEEVAHKKPTPFYLNNWFRASAAAVILTIVSATAYLLFQKSPDKTFAQQEQVIPETVDIAPGNNSALLTLEDGSTILLDSAVNGSLAQQGNTNVIKSGNQISYELEDGRSNNKIPVYNTVTTANSNQYHLTLSDGTKVWLNAASSIRFPAFFFGSERKVEVTGEVYFEVAKSNRQKFIVDIKYKDGQAGVIEVLGTHFNVNAYSNEPDIKTTLLEGSIKIAGGNSSRMLAPGQQGQISNGSIQLNQQVNLEQVMAWKNGYFLFNNTDLQTLMRQVSRWYNVEVSFEGTINADGFSGKISREVPLSVVLQALELNDVNVTRVGRNLVVRP